MGNLQISLSSLCFERWCETLPGLSALRGSLHPLLPTVDGIELSFSVREILTPDSSKAWHLIRARDRLRRDGPQNRGCPVSIYLHDLDRLAPRDLPLFIRALRQLLQRIKVTSVCVRRSRLPIGAIRWLKGELPADTSLAVENRPLQSSNGEELADLSSLLQSIPGVSAALDLHPVITDNVAIGHVSIVSFIDTFRTRISSIHLSTPGSDDKADSPDRTLCSGHIDQGLGRILASIAPGTTVTLRGAAPSMQDGLLAHEIATVRVLSRASRLAA